VERRLLAAAQLPDGTSASDAAAAVAALPERGAKAAAAAAKAAAEEEAALYAQAANRTVYMHLSAKLLQAPPAAVSAEPLPSSPVRTGEHPCGQLLKQ
jgi:hypothetical protein